MCFMCNRVAYRKLYRQYRGQTLPSDSSILSRLYPVQGKLCHYITRKDTFLVVKESPSAFIRALDDYFSFDRVRPVTFDSI